VIIEQMFERRSQSVNPAHPRDPLLASLFGLSANTSAGVSITPDRAMRIVAVYAAVRIIAETVASLPLNVYQGRDDGGKEVTRAHPLYPLLHDQPNAWQTSFEWREMMVGHAALRGNAYSEIIHSNGGSVEALIPLHPDRVIPFMPRAGTMAYEYAAADGRSRIILQDEMHHLRGLSADGVKGYDPVDLARDSLGLTAASEEFGARFFGNGTVAGGYLKHPQTLSEDAQKRLIKSWEERHRGPQRSHRPAVLEEGMEWQAIGIEPEKAQFLETRKFQIADIARMFRVPPHMLADLDRATNNNIEHQSLEFLMHTIRPWLVRHEQAIRRDLFSIEDRRKHFAKYLVNALLRGDVKSRGTFYKEMFGIGAMSPNDVRELEDLNPIDGGDQYFIQSNNVAPLTDPVPKDDEDDLIRALTDLVKKNGSDSPDAATDTR
tara:strand:+ start:16399 stop:17700 length:1302 start_codon:yes stop_codon:yes gene_type:complete